MDEVKLLPCDRCGGKRTVRDIKPGVDWLRVYPEQMPCPDCTDGTWADAESTRPPIVTDEVVERVVREAAEPWADYHGDLPDYDHPLRPVFESGVQYAVELLAKMLHVEDWEICDGTEEFDGDLGGTLLNIVVKTWPVDEQGDWIDFRDPKNRIAAMPTIDQDEGENV